MNTDNLPNIRWAAYAVTTAALAGLLLLLLSFTQPSEIMQLGAPGTQETVLFFPNSLLKITFVALAVEVLALIPVILTVHRVVSFGSNIRWVYPLTTAFGVIGAIGVAVTQFFLAATKVPIGDCVSLSSGIGALLGTWMALGSVCWGEQNKILPRRFYWLSLTTGIALALIPNFVSFEGLGSPASLATNDQLLAGLATEIVGVFIAIPIWVLWFAHALSAHSAPAPAS